jgi:hypothetical protein
MIQFVHCLLCLLLCLLLSLSFGKASTIKSFGGFTSRDGPSPQPTIHDPDAEYALNELKKLSETGIYDTLSIKNVKHEGARDGIFHINTMLTLELASPFFESGKETEEFRFIVMKHKFDNVTTLAVDEFPVMKEDAIEEFYIQMVKERRKKRQQAFAELIGETNN